MLFTFIKIILIIQIKSSLSAKSYRDQFKTICGRRNDLKRVVGGTDALQGEFPFFARIGQTKPKNRFSFFCGGSLITDMHILSADHCFQVTAEDQEIDQLVVGLGLHFRKKVIPENIYSVDKLIPFHVNETAYQDDIALLVLENKVKFTGLIYPICLPDNISPNSLVGVKMTVIGFGMIDTIKEWYPKILQKATLTIKKLKQCEDVFQGLARYGKLCAGSKNQDSCSGDSGGPLFKLLEINGVSRFTQFGIVSYGTQSCTDDYPAVYTDIHYFLNWIDSYMRI